MQKGDTVVVWDGQVFFGFWKPAGIRGKVAMVDKDGGVCVELFVSPAFKPCFWFQENEVTPNPQPGYTAPTLSELENTFVGGRKASMNACPIRADLLRSWLLIKLRAQPGQSLFDQVIGMAEPELLPLYNDTTDRAFTLWANANDTRPKRVLIAEDSEATIVAPTVRRPRLV